MRTIVRAARTSDRVFDVALPSKARLSVEAGAHDRPGSAAGPAPMELMLASLTTCAGATIDAILARMRLPAVAVNVVADAERAVRPPRTYTSISLEFHVASAASDERLARAVDLTERTCSASVMLGRATTLATRVVAVRPVDPVRTRELRQQILRPHQTIDELVDPGESAPGAAWFAATVDAEVVGTVGLLPEPSPDGGPTPQMRLRSMAIATELRGRGLGRLLLEAAVIHAWEQGARSVWCSARSGAADFYARAGFTTTSEPFDVPVIGGHVRMSIAHP